MYFFLLAHFVMSASHSIHFNTCNSPGCHGSRISVHVSLRRGRRLTSRRATASSHRATFSSRRIMHSAFFAELLRTLFCSSWLFFALYVDACWLSTVLSVCALRVLLSSSAIRLEMRFAFVMSRLTIVFCLHGRGRKGQPSTALFVSGLLSSGAARTVFVSLSRCAESLSRAGHRLGAVGQ